MSSRLLLFLAEDVDIPPGHVGDVRGVITSALLAQFGHLGNLLRGKFNLLEVGLDTRCRHRLGDDAVATDLGPGQDDLGGGNLGAESLGRRLGNLLDLGAGDQQGNAEAVVTEGLNR